MKSFKIKVENNYCRSLTSSLSELHYLVPETWDANAVWRAVFSNWPWKCSRQLLQRHLIVFLQPIWAGRFTTPSPVLMPPYIEERLCLGGVPEQGCAHICVILSDFRFHHKHGEVQWSSYIWTNCNYIILSCSEQHAKGHSPHLPLNFKMGGLQTLLCHLQSKMALSHRHCLTLFWDYILPGKPAIHTDFLSPRGSVRVAAGLRSSIFSTI